MFSTFLEICGFALLTAGAAVVGGTAAGLFTGGACLLLVGYALEDDKATVALARMLRPVRLRLALLRETRTQRKLRGQLSPSKAG